MSLGVEQVEVCLYRTFHGKLPELLTLNVDNSCSAFVLGFSFIRAKLSLKSSPCLGLSFNVDNL